MTAGRHGAAVAGALLAILLLAACGTAPGAAPAATPAPAAPAAATTSAPPAAGAPAPIWADEFDGPLGQAPDPARWTAVTGGTGWGNRELQYYSDSTGNAALDGAGHLVITAHEGGGHDCWYGPCRYTSARLTSKGKFSQAHGRFEARIRVPRGVGVWPAFWLLGDTIDEVGHPAAGEIDVMENIGSDPHGVLSIVHAPDQHDGHTEQLPAPVADDFHVFAVDWTPERLTFSIDGRTHLVVVPRRDVEVQPFDDPFHVLLNVAVGGNWPGPPDASTTLPQSMVVDYVRVWPLGALPVPNSQEPAG